MTDTLARSKRETAAIRETLRKSLGTLGNNEPRLRQEGPNFFDELKENVHQIQSTHYSPVKVERHVRKEVKGRVAKYDFAEPEEVHVSSEPRTDHKELLLARLERQSLSIEKLEAELRQLRLQNKQLSGYNRLREVHVEAKPNNSRELEALEAENVRLQEENSLLNQQILQYDEDKWRSQTAVQKLKTAVQIYKERYAEVKGRLDASVGINAFQAQTIARLRNPLEDLDDTTRLLLGNNYSDLADGTTTNLIQGTRPYDVMRIEKTKSRLKAYLLAVVFVTRLKRQVANRNRWRSEVGNTLGEI